MLIDKLWIIGEKWCAKFNGSIDRTIFVYFWIKCRQKNQCHYFQVLNYFWQRGRKIPVGPGIRKNRDRQGDRHRHAVHPRHVSHRRKVFGPVRRQNRRQKVRQLGPRVCQGSLLRQRSREFHQEWRHRRGQRPWQRPQREPAVFAFESVRIFQDRNNFRCGSHHRETLWPGRAGKNELKRIE